MGPFGFKVTTSCVTVIEIYFLELNGFRVASRKVTREKEIRKKKKKGNLVFTILPASMVISWGLGKGFSVSFPLAGPEGECEPEEAWRNKGLYWASCHLGPSYQYFMIDSKP